MPNRVLTTNEIRAILTDFDGTKHSFNMSGYDGGKPGSCEQHNNAIMMRFAPFGLYDYTHFLAFDCYKGMPTVHFKYWGEDEVREKDYSGWSTSTIIHDIFQLTVGSGRPTRRRD